jgi:putative two-component system response regulator
MAVADVYDALRDKRVYKPAFSHEERGEIILSDSGKHFDPLVVKAFLNAESEFIDFMKDQGNGREATLA